MVDSQLIKDVMVPAVQLEANETAHDALQKLYQENVEYGVASDESGELFTVVTKEQLSAAKEDQHVHALTTSMPHQIPIDPNDSLDTIMRTRSEDLVINQDLMGIVVREQNDVLGILLRKTIEEYKQEIAATMSDPRTRGTPIVKIPKLIWFECSICNERKSITPQDYDPDNLPKCLQEHDMRPIRV